jgi:hypothetical protein
MPDRVRRIPPALKHAVYSTTALLPGEDPAAFKKLHQGLIAELTPNGPLEEDIVATIARLVWRKQNLKSFQIAERAQKRWEAIQMEKMPGTNPFRDIDVTGIDGLENFDPREAFRAARQQARAELGPEYAFIEMKETATVDQLLKDLEVEEQLDAMISRRLKQLLFLRGLKSMSTVPASALRPGLLASAKAK